VAVSTDGKSKQSEQIDGDILQCRADVLRAADIIPGKSPQNTGTKPQNKIPKFDLAEEIMAQQRKITALRRKSPAVISTRSIGHAGKQPIETPLAQEQIIAEIVARDIERLCKGVQNRQG
jgi:hypothetical protein